MRLRSKARGAALLARAVPHEARAAAERATEHRGEAPREQPPGGRDDAAARHRGARGSREMP